jgi:signal transduction histidine kinase
VATAFTVLVTAQVPARHLAALELPSPWVGCLPALTLTSAGAVVLWHRATVLGPLLVVCGGWCALNAAGGAWLARATAAEPALPGAAPAFFVFMRLGAGLLLVLPLILLLYPHGRLPTGPMRRPALASLAATAVLPALLLVVPSSVAELQSTDRPLPDRVLALELDPLAVPLPDQMWMPALRIALVLVPLSLVVPFLVVVGRYHRATGTDRLRMRWLLWAGLVDVLVMLAFAVLPDGLGPFGLPTAIAVTAGAVAVGLVRPEVVDVERLLDGTVVYGGLLVLSYLLDLALLGLAGSLLGARLTGTESLALAVFAVSLAYAPARHRLRRLLRHRAHGERHDPYGVVSRLAARLESSDTPADQLLVIARAVRRAFRTPYAGVEVLQDDGEHLTVEHGTAPGRTEAMPIAYRGELVGWLHLPAGPVQRLRGADEALLADMVRQAAAAARTGRLADQLQQSRERMVTAVEDERRRLRNELHDGLGPTLAAVASRIDTARITARRSADEADQSLATARGEITELIAEVRRLVHGLRPPALDDVGLAGAVRQQADRLKHPGLALTVEIASDTGALPAAVEVAAYRIVSEALTNVVRHAAAQRATVRIDDGGTDLVVEVTDDGVGVGAATQVGVGLCSMRERARELGGRCTVEPVSGGGTRVLARLPLLPLASDTSPGGIP